MCWLGSPATGFASVRGGNGWGESEQEDLSFTGGARVGAGHFGGHRNTIRVGAVGSPGLFWYISICVCICTEKGTAVLLE